MIKSNPSRKELCCVYSSDHLPSLESNHNHRDEFISSLPLHLTCHQLRTWWVVSYDLLLIISLAPCSYKTPNTRLTKSATIQFLPHIQ